MSEMLFVDLNFYLLNIFILHLLTRGKYMVCMALEILFILVKN